jgi:hypothetical protein
MPLNHIEGKQCYLALTTSGFAKNKDGDIHPATRMFACYEISTGEPLAWNFAVALLYAHFYSPKQAVELENTFNQLKQGKTQKTQDFLVQATDAARGLQKDYLTCANMIRNALQPGPGKVYLVSLKLLPKDFSTYERFRTNILLNWSEQMKAVTTASYVPAVNNPREYPALGNRRDERRPTAAAAGNESERPAGIKGQCTKCGPEKVSYHITANHKDVYLPRAQWDKKMADVEQEQKTKTEQTTKANNTTTEPPVKKNTRGGDGKSTSG